MITIKNSEEIEKMRATCKLAADTLYYTSQFLRAGISTDELNQKAHEYILDHHATPSPLNYHGFPKSICTSRNNVICHGIPSANDILQEGDIINLDVTTYLNGFHGDTSATFLIGEVKEKILNLVKVTHECLYLAINEVRPDAHLGNIGAVIEEHARKFKYGIVEDYCGHGIGKNFHEDPQVLHIGKRNQGVVLKEGMIFTIEPMINLGKKGCKLLGDGWTVITADGKSSAQFEHTILVTSTGFEVLTNWDSRMLTYL